ncbi:DUF3887 domain-containing protein [Pedobacter metabolipauper]|uniref:Serine aminopeptidase S33 family n=1 Tax=Pedobacter metabolipauper TaxID=425513 RepID=A0A4R6SUQ1_9SPHI|nr:DUF3887 domain-containing protein [Pedobacter metabolipauper]TDQ08788.1 hypothetical protein ATK78_3306 [Pedobacter metabolipauper]
MKKVVLLFFTVLITTSAFSQGLIGLLGKSQDFFTLLNEEKYQEAYLYFDTTFHAKFSEPDLKQLWTNLNTGLGKFKSADIVSSKTEGDFFVITMEGNFEKDTQNFLFAYNKAEKIVGFYLPGKTNAVAYAKPTYASDTTLYKETEIYVKTPGHELVGILTAPKNAANFPIVVLVHGSGPHDMDETVGPNKPLKDIALGLASQGIASIRYVKRTMIYNAEFYGAFTVKEELVDDAIAAVELAKTIPAANKSQIYLLGHSLGGMLAPRIATLSPDLKGILLLAAPARKMTDLIIEQNNYMYSLSKDTSAATKKQMTSLTTEIQKTRLNTLGKMKPDSSVLGLPASYWIDINNYDQVAVAKSLNKKIFVAQGALDFQVSVADYELWNAALAQNKNAVLKLYPQLNHLMSFQGMKGTSKQYESPASVSEDLVNDIASWIKAK